jgi:hypothetical protein
LEKAAANADPKTAQGKKTIELYNAAQKIKNNIKAAKDEAKDETTDEDTSEKAKSTRESSAKSIAEDALSEFSISRSKDRN